MLAVADGAAAALQRSSGKRNEVETRAPKLPAVNKKPICVVVPSKEG